MKYTKIFNTESEYSEFAGNGDFIAPTLCAINENYNLIYNQYYTPITFSVGHYGQIIEYNAFTNMTWEEWINSDFNPMLPDGKNRLFSTTNDMGEYSGYVWYNIWYEDIKPNGTIIGGIDYSTELVDSELSDNAYATALTEPIRNKHLYIA